MSPLTLTICLLPIVFMFHDFEEIIFFKPWINKNSAYLKEHFPRLSKKFLSRFESLSTSGFALAVAEEFLLLSFITYGSVYFNNYYLWISAFMAFFIHLIMHVAQWIILRRYIPMIVTSLISLPYCVYALIEILENNMFQVSEIVLWTFVGLIAMVINVLFAHKLGTKLDRWLDKKQLKTNQNAQQRTIAHCRFRLKILILSLYNFCVMAQVSGTSGKSFLVIHLLPYRNTYTQVVCKAFRQKKIQIFRVTDKNDQKTNNWDIALLATYFFIPFYGLRIALENYLMEDDLGIEYTMLLGLVSAISVTIYLTILRTKSLKTKVIGLGTTLLLVIIVNILMS